MDQCGCSVRVQRFGETAQDNASAAVADTISGRTFQPLSLDPCRNFMSCVEECTGSSSIAPALAFDTAALSRAEFLLQTTTPPHPAARHTHWHSQLFRLRRQPS